MQKNKRVKRATQTSNKSCFDITQKINKKNAKFIICCNIAKFNDDIGKLVFYAMITNVNIDIMQTNMNMHYKII